MAAAIPTILAAYDNDTEGNSGVECLIAQCPRIGRVRVPEGEDITDFWQRGGDLRRWAGSLCACLMPASLEGVHSDASKC